MIALLATVEIRRHEKFTGSTPVVFERPPFDERVPSSALIERADTAWNVTIDTRRFGINRDDVVISGFDIQTEWPKF
jgi:hypothetical protein